MRPTCCATVSSTAKVLITVTHYFDDKILDLSQKPGNITERAFLIARTWSATALYDTSATETSGSSQNAVASWQKRHSKQYRPDSEDEKFRQNDMGVSDSGLGTTALDYATTIGTCVIHYYRPNACGV